jgi:uncharacterized protein
MASGLLALLDDIAAIAKVAAASIDDVALAAGKASTKAAGVVIDDTAVTPQYVTGFTPDRELPIIWRITKGSFKNKLLFILPVALILSYFAPWAVTPILMVGGAYLCFEGAEKVLHKIFHGAEDDDDTPAEIVSELSSKDHEAAMVSGAIRTDFILSAEIMVISLKEILKDPQFSSSVWMQAFSLAVVAIAITIAVYGFVGLIVKMDDIGLNMAQRKFGVTRAIGRGLVTGMPKLLTFLSAIGTAAMLWVGGQIIIHGLHIHPAEYFGLHTGTLAWVTDAAICGVFGLALGSAIAGIMHVITGIRKEDEVTTGI